MSHYIRKDQRWLWTLAVILLLTSSAWALEPPEAPGRAVAVESIITSWESVDARLSSLLDQLPSEAHSGIQRAIAANRDGRQRALDALNSGGSDDDDGAGTLRAQRALEEAAARAESGLNDARLHVPAHVLPRLDQAAAQMRAGIAAGAAGIANQPAAGARSAALPGAGSPDIGRPAIDRPAGVGRPVGVGRSDAAGRRRPRPGRPGQ